VIVVVPARAEGDIRMLLSSLASCHPVAVGIEVIVVVNASEDDGEVERSANRHTCESVRQWRTDVAAVGLKSKGQGCAFSVHLVCEEQLPRERAGVGTARKIGLDEAVNRLLQAGVDDGVLLNLDADCTVSERYFTDVVGAFSGPDVNVAHLYFEHELPGDESLRNAMTDYELYLRVHVAALRLIDAPLRCHTVGSCIAVRASAYVALGGMNRRQGGEDFYFLNKVAQRFEIVELSGMTVYPSARFSQRTPFGTGQALQRALPDALPGDLPMYDPRTYGVVFTALRALDRAYYIGPGEWVDSRQLFGVAAGFFDDLEWREKVHSAREGVASAQAYTKRIRVWFDGFQVIKLANWLSLNAFSKVPVRHSARTIAYWHEGALDESSLVTLFAGVLAPRQPLHVGGTTDHGGIDATGGANIATILALLQWFRALDRACGRSVAVVD